MSRTFKMEKILYQSLKAAIVVVPFWMTAGRCLMGGPGGWLLILLMSFAAPVLFLYHILLFGIVRHQNRYSNPEDYQLSREAGMVLGIYYLLQFALQLFLADGGDSFVNPSIASKLVGLSGKMSGQIAELLFVMIVLLMVILLCVVICYQDRNCRDNEEGHNGGESELCQELCPKQPTMQENQQEGSNNCIRHDSGNVI